jgi:hypothetical protein
MLHLLVLYLNVIHFFYKENIKASFILLKIFLINYIGFFAYNNKIQY